METRRTIQEIGFRFCLEQLNFALSSGRIDRDNIWTWNCVVVFCFGCWNCLIFALIFPRHKYSDFILLLCTTIANCYYYCWLLYRHLLNYSDLLLTTEIIFYQELVRLLFLCALETGHIFLRWFYKQVFLAGHYFNPLGSSCLYSFFCVGILLSIFIFWWEIWNNNLISQLVDTTKFHSPGSGGSKAKLLVTSFMIPTL